MDLSERLRRLGVLRGVNHIKASASRPQRRGGIEQWVDGCVVQNHHGTFFLAEQTFTADHPHGGRPLLSLLQHTSETLAQLTGDDSLKQLDLRSATFIDVETTGLAGGTGTYAFLIGIGSFAGDCFRLRQLFMRDYHEEPAILSALAEYLATAQGLISFNGRHFDLPLLETRYMMARQRPPFLASPHFDLLYPVRWLWRTRLSSCALSALEQNILGVTRDGRDVPGWEIPYLYFNYIRGGNAAEMARVFYHNAQDILSMVVLTARICELVRAPEYGASEHALDLLSVGRLFGRLGLTAESERAYRHALTCDCDPDVRGQVLHDLSFLCKRMGRWEEAVAVWQELRATGQCGLIPHVELAKYYEHHSNEIERAIEVVTEAMERRLATCTADLPGESYAELTHRLNRLRAKRQRHHTR